MISGRIQGFGSSEKRFSKITEIVQYIMSESALPLIGLLKTENQFCVIVKTKQELIFRQSFVSVYEARKLYSYLLDNYLRLKDNVTEENVRHIASQHGKLSGFSAFANHNQNYNRFVNVFKKDQG